MASQNEVYKLLGRTLTDSGFLDSACSVGQGSSGKMYLKLGPQIFQIVVDELDQFQETPDPYEATARFMETLPYPYTKDE